ncbi:hypothetical protein CSUI_010902, partial [Cystoisospora suis]
EEEGGGVAAIREDRKDIVARLKEDLETFLVDATEEEIEREEKKYAEEIERSGIEGKKGKKTFVALKEKRAEQRRKELAISELREKAKRQQRKIDE